MSEDRGDRIEIAWTRDKYPKQRLSIACQDGESASRVYHRLCGMLQEVVNEETQKGVDR